MKLTYFPILLALAGCASGPSPIDVDGRDEGPIRLYTPPKVCPPDDGHAWYYRKPAYPTTAVLWVQIIPGTNPCGFSGPAPVGSSWAACGRPGGADGIGVVTAYAPRFAYSETLIHHEECHTLGWLHGSHFPD